VETRSGSKPGWDLAKRLYWDRGRPAAFVEYQLAQIGGFNRDLRELVA